jgi:hypothetical protein
MTPIGDYTFRMKPSITEPRENYISSRLKCFRNLRIVFSQLHDIASLVNSTYGFSLLCAIIWLVTYNIAGVNYFIDSKRTDFLYVLDGILWLSVPVCLMAIMTVSCSLAVNECNLSSVIVQKIMLRDDIDSEVMKELKMMFAHFKVMKIEFSACEMYKIDLSLFCDIIGATISYIIIFSSSNIS